MTLKLWTREFSGNCYKVRLLLSFLGIKAEEIQVDTKNNEQKSQEYRRLNPRMQIPALQDGEVFVDSASILVYLAGKYSKEHQWYSTDLMEQVKIVEWLAFTASWIEPGLAKARVLVSLGRADLSQDPIVEAKLKEAQDKAVGSLAILENEFKAGKEWLVAARVTIADVAVFPYVALAPMGDVSLDPYPNVKSWIQRMKELPNFISMPGQDDPLYIRR